MTARLGQIYVDQIIKVHCGIMYCENCRFLTYDNRRPHRCLLFKRPLKEKDKCDGPARCVVCLKASKRLKQIPLKTGRK